MVDIEDVKRIVRTLESDCIDDAEDLLVWLGSDGVVILKEYIGLKEGVREERRARLEHWGMAKEARCQEQ